MTEEKQALKLNFKPLGDTGIQVSEVCLGGMTFSFGGVGGWGLPAAKEDESHLMLQYFEEIGGNFIDTANVYKESEAVIGKWLATKKRDDWVIATKVGSNTFAGINAKGLSRRHITSAIDQSLKDLQTHYVDLYQCHIPDPNTPFSETFRTLDDLVRCGKIRYIGVSNYTGVQLQQIIDLAHYTGLNKVVCLQPQYNLLCRFIEWDLIPLCQQNKIAIIPWSPLAGGWLSGKHKKEKPVEGSRVNWAESVGWKATAFSSLNNEKTWNILNTVEEIGKENGMTDAQVSLRWLMQKPGVTAPIIGAKTLDQLKDNMGCVAKQLSDDQMKRLDEVSAIPTPYPWKFP